jgi:hypothetical protein
MHQHRADKASNSQTDGYARRWAKTKTTHSKMRLYFLSLFILLTSSLFAQKSYNDSSTLLTVTREKYSFQYPKTWAIDTSKMFGMDILLRSPKTDSLDDFRENINVFVQNLKGYDYNLTKMGKESEAQIKNMVTDLELIESRLDSSTSLQTYIIHYKGRQGKYMLTTIQHYYLYNETGFAVTLTIQNGKEQEYIPMGNIIFNSFMLH